MGTAFSFPNGTARTVFERIIALLVAFSVVGASVYAYYHVVYSKCQVPVLYDIGTIDSEFGITEEEVRAALSDAESLWEDATGKNLFTYSKGAALRVNFVYDERQAESDEQHELIDVLDRKAEMSESIRESYEKLLAAYEELKNDYEAKVVSYKKRLAAHNATVEEWNTKGGAPQDVYQSLQATSASLNAEISALNATAQQLNSLARQINQVGEKGNAVVQDYNKNVESFNDRYGHESEYTQGDYTGDTIQIYQYDDAKELRRVLAHELGHALGLEHVADPEAIMHHVLEGEHPLLALRYDDLVEYQKMCGTK